MSFHIPFVGESPFASIVRAFERLNLLMLLSDVTLTIGLLVRTILESNVTSFVWAAGPFLRQLSKIDPRSSGGGSGHFCGRCERCEIMLDM